MRFDWPAGSCPVSCWVAWGRPRSDTDTHLSHLPYSSLFFHLLSKLESHPLKMSLIKVLSLFSSHGCTVSAHFIAIKNPTPAQAIKENAWSDSFYFLSFHFSPEPNWQHVQWAIRLGRWEDRFCHCSVVMATDWKNSSGNILNNRTPVSDVAHTRVESFLPQELWNNSENHCIVLSPWS